MYKDFKNVCDLLAIMTFAVLKAFSFLLCFVFLVAFILFELKFTIKKVNVFELAGTKAVIQKKVNSETGLRYLTPRGAEIFRLILKFSDDISPTQAYELARLIREECEISGIDPLLVLALIHVESGFNPQAISSKGAIGLMQVMPKTARSVADEMGISINGIKSLYNPVINVRLGIYYISQLINRFESVEKALMAYNMGPSRFLSVKGASVEKSSFVRKVFYFKSILEREKTSLEEI
ncbi:MAG: hypothetical protein KatS3mg078_0559 [Deltaproteobacteria bacterium]|nr:MAG: hypothetical protein KatS3mg078_0559 [Deltaproteobacteria bacterium]